MSLNDWKYDEKLIDRISQGLRRGNVSHAYIVEGDTCVNKTLFAKDFLKAVICKEKPGTGCDNCVSCMKIDHNNYEDLYMIKADGLSIKDDDIFGLQEKLKRKPVGGDRNMTIIENADTMTPRAQNRLLKTLEEPFPGTIILLLSENRENLLETIRSRCITYRLNNLEIPDSDLFNQARELIDALIEGMSFYQVKLFLSSHVKTRDDAFELLDVLEREYRQMLVNKDERSKLIRNADIFRYVQFIEEARRDLQIKVNYNYALKNLMIKIGG